MLFVYRLVFFFFFGKWVCYIIYICIMLLYTYALLGFVCLRYATEVVKFFRKHKTIKLKWSHPVTAATWYTQPAIFLTPTAHYIPIYLYTKLKQLSLDFPFFYSVISYPLILIVNTRENVFTTGYVCYICYIATMYRYVCYMYIRIIFKHIIFEKSSVCS